MIFMSLVQSLMLIFSGTFTQGKNVFVCSCVYEICKLDPLWEPEIVFETVYWKSVLGRVFNNPFDVICLIFVQIFAVSSLMLQIFRNY